MSWQPIFVVTLLLGSTFSQKVDPDKWNTVEVLCGKLIQVEEIPGKGTANSFTEKRKPIKNASLRLYHRNKDATCCSTESRAAETISRKGGSFEFKDIVPGSYWIVGRLAGIDYKLAVNYKPSNKGSVKCSDLSYELKNGEIQLTRMVQVD